MSKDDQRDDLETLAPPSPAGSRCGFPFGVLNVPTENRCRVSSICQSVDSRVIGLNAVEEKEAGIKEEDKENVASPLNKTIMNFEEERLDLNSVLSGKMDDETVKMHDDDANGVSVKNLSRLFEENDERRNAKPVNRPPLAPSRSNPKSDEAASKTDYTNDNKSLSVYLRIRPPVSATGKEGVDGSISTIEVLNESSNGNVPTMIRTYPPLSSNAAKVVRNGNKLAIGPNKNFSKSLNEDRISGDENGEVLGVKEYAYSGVFGPNSIQSEIYDKIAAPLVDGLFPENRHEELRGSALLFTLGVTNAGKT